MTTSDQINELATALAAAQGEMEGATKDSANPFFRSRYADLASVRDACRAPLAKHGLCVVQFPRVTFTGAPEPYEWQAKQSGETRYGVRVVTTVSVLTRIIHASGQYLEDEMSTMLPTGDPQAVGSATTYLRRYALMAACAIAPEDDDAETAQGRGNGQTSKPQAVLAKAPKGYSDWLMDLTATADEGTAALQTAWKSSTAEFRAYLTATNAAQWENLKTRAAKVSKPVSA